MGSFNVECGEDGTTNSEIDYKPSFDFKYYKEKISNKNANKLLSNYLRYKEIKSLTSVAPEKQHSIKLRQFKSVLNRD